MPNFLDGGMHDFMARSTVLRKHGSTRTFFDAKNAKHRASLAAFLQTGNWGAVQFYPEYPYTDVPMTVLRKFAASGLNIEFKSKATEVEDTQE